MGNKFEILARALIIEDGSLLVCKNKTEGHSFLPGGHVEFGEKAEQALKRELKEEMGLETEIRQFAGIVENMFTQDGITHHEVKLIYEVSLPTKDIVSKESWIEFEWVTLNDLVRVNFLPAGLREVVVQWSKDRKIFSASFT